MKLKDVAPWGRTLKEYQLMFNLSDADLSRKILGCGDGPASFNAEMTELGYNVTSIDPIYQKFGVENPVMNDGFTLNVLKCEHDRTCLQVSLLPNIRARKSFATDNGLCAFGL